MAAVMRVCLVDFVGVLAIGLIVTGASPVAIICQPHGEVCRFITEQNAEYRS